METSSLINDISDYEMSPITDEIDNEHGVKLEIIEWKCTTQKALYLCDEESFPLLRVLEKRFHTGYFHFSAYLQSSYFADLDESDQLKLAEMYPVVAEAIDQAQQQIRQHFLERASKDSKSVVEEWKAENVYPYHGEAAGPIEQVERKVFDIVATTANDFIPEFKEAPTKQKAMHLHMLRSALERSPEDLQLIFQEVLDLPARKRKELADLLADISLTGVINAAKTVSDRLKFLDGLETILYDEGPKRRLKERSQLHRILAEEAWVFGEEFHLTADDEGLTKVLQKYARKMNLDVVIDKPVKRIDETTGIIDLMLSRSRPSYKPEDTNFLVVELKRPSVKVGSEETTQIESYAFAVADDERFRSVNTKWDFWIISNEMDRHAQLKAKQKDMPPGVIFRHSEMDLTIWAKTWGQVMDENRSRLRFFQERLEQKVRHEKGLKYLSTRYGSILEGVLEEEPEVEPEEDAA